MPCSPTPTKRLSSINSTFKNDARCRPRRSSSFGGCHKGECRYGLKLVVHHAPIAPQSGAGALTVGRPSLKSLVAYEEAYRQLFAMLDTLELRLSKRKFLLGDRITEADVRLFTTLVRFDAVYFGHFKCNRNRLVDFTELWDYTRALYQHQGIADTVRLDQIKTHYYGSHRTINPTGIVPNGPQIDFLAPTKRRPV
jgi:glutathionyl-hydroquinone reductase